MAKGFFAGFLRNQQVGLTALIDLTQKKRRQLALRQREFGLDSLILDGQRHPRNQANR